MVVAGDQSFVLNSHHDVGCNKYKEGSVYSVYCVLLLLAEKLCDVRIGSVREVSLLDVGN